jgi:hypothetical protein
MTEVLIMAVPWVPERTLRAVKLMHLVGGRIVWDEKHDGMDTWLRTLDEAGIEPVIILEDDVILSSRWQEAVEAEIDDHPTSVIQFFSRGKDDLIHGSRWRPGSSFSMNQCYYLPAGAAWSLRLFADTWMQEHPGDNGYDLLMAAWLKSTGQRYWLRVPSLVQHEEWKSQLGSRSSKRQSTTFDHGELDARP